MYFNGGCLNKTFPVILFLREICISFIARMLDKFDKTIYNLDLAVENCPCLSCQKKDHFSPKGGICMNKYELLYIISSDVAEEKREELIKKFASYVENKGGSVEGIDKWGMRKLAYPINFKNEGFYVLMNITMNPAEVDAMAKLMNITEGIVRQLFVRK